MNMCPICAGEVLMTVMLNASVTNGEGKREPGGGISIHCGSFQCSWHGEGHLAGEWPTVAEIAGAVDDANKTWSAHLAEHGYIKIQAH